jgi:hypothetical protein
MEYSRKVRTPLRGDPFPIPHTQYERLTRYFFFIGPGASILPAAVVAAYVGYLTHQALASEPVTGSETAGDTIRKCAPFANAAGGRGGGEPAQIAGAALTLLSVAYSAYRAGSMDFFGDSDGGDGEQTSALLDSGDASGDDVGLAGAEFPTGPTTYSYSFFHAVFALASAYLGMLLTGWGSSGFGTGDPGGGPRDIRNVDSGWASVWVKILSAWVTAALYAWTVVAPVVVEDRDFF